MRWWCILLTNLFSQTLCNDNLTVAPLLTVASGNIHLQQPLAQENFLIGIASLGVLHETNNTQCGQELEIFLKAIADRKVWAIKVIDNFGTAPKSFTWGNYFWLSTPDLCEDLNNAYVISMAHSKPLIFNASSPIRLQFIVVYMNFTTPYSIDLKLPFENLIHIGLCLPKSCNVSHIRHFTDLYFQRRTFSTQQYFDLDMKSYEIKTTHFSVSEYFPQIGCILFILIFFSSLVIPLIAVAVAKLQNTKQPLEQPSLCKNVQKFGGELDQQPCPTHLKRSSLWEKLLMCFHSTANYATVISLENSNRNAIFLTSMAGLRCIICMWITVFHVYYYSLFTMSNTPFIFAKLEEFILQPVMQACFYVDVFFVMSSFLLVFNFLSNEKQLRKIRSGTWWENLKIFLKSIMQRYMRLTPVMIITMLLSTMASDFLNMYSPFRMGEHSGFHCKNNWWYNLLYIHNFLDMNVICCSWTWYLACEMQYYVAFSAMLYLYVKHPSIGKIVFAIFALGSVAIAWFTNYYNGITFEIDVIYSTLDELYVKPWVRIPPYIGGATMGWLMYTQQQRKSQMSGNQDHSEPHLKPPRKTYMKRIFWFLCCMIYISTNFMSYWRSIPTWAVATIMSVGKLIFALFVGRVIIECSRDRGGLLNSLLSARPFLFLNKFCFSIYMLAPIIVVAMFGLRREATNFTEVGSGADFMAIIVLSISSGMVLYILVELPMQRVTNVLFKLKRSQTA
ncbi:nose resistant to fluoxetine protein 6-like [Haematobia irritans]|uniref:nose resistant to fluoxetine protein 6-like n=1 Tax=Haematobia irritans TaxID=7368 RepID=UPI003F502756